MGFNWNQGATYKYVGNSVACSKKDICHKLKWKWSQTIGKLTNVTRFFDFGRSSRNPKWNELQAVESEANEDWFGAVFHLEKILSLNPENKDVKTRIATAKDRLKAK
jgi:hypothetical protein